MRLTLSLLTLSLFLSACTSDATTPTGSQIKLQKSATGVSLITPKAGETIKSPLAITGTAPGTWFSEGVLPVSLIDGNGAVITSANGEANGEWMTTALVPFSVTLTFPSQKGEGTIVVENDNPSGDSDKAMKKEFPVKF